MREMDLLDRIGDKFTVGDGCWEWTASRTTAGYGQTSVAGKYRMAHRALYELLVGPIPNGLQLDHLCRNRGCVRPDHLEPVTQAENLRRGERWQQRKTHCPQGHEYDEANTYVTPSRPTARYCRECNRVTGVERQRRYRARKRETA